MATAATEQVDIYEVASHLWEAADELRANSHLKAAEYSIPVLGLIFLKFADSRFTEAESAARRRAHRAAHHRQARLPEPWRPLPAEPRPVRESP